MTSTSAFSRPVLCVCERERVDRERERALYVTGLARHGIQFIFFKTHDKRGGGSGQKGRETQRKRVIIDNYSHKCQRGHPLR